MQEVAFGDPSQDAGDEVRFSVELTRLDRLNDTFSLDIRRLKGNLRSYKFLYDTLRKYVGFTLFFWGSVPDLNLFLAAVPILQLHKLEICQPLPLSSQCTTTSHRTFFLLFPFLELLNPFVSY
jgi:hypothetical protein